MHFVTDAELQMNNQKLMTLIKQGGGISGGGASSTVVQLLESGTDLNGVTKAGRYAINNFGTLFPFVIKENSRLNAELTGIKNPEDATWIIKTPTGEITHTGSQINLPNTFISSVYVFNVDFGTEDSMIKFEADCSGIVIACEDMPALAKVRLDRGVKLIGDISEIPVSKELTLRYVDLSEASLNVASLNKSLRRLQLRMDTQEAGVQITGNISDLAQMTTLILVQLPRLTGELSDIVLNHGLVELRSLPEITIQLDKLSGNVAHLRVSDVSVSGVLNAELSIEELYIHNSGLTRKEIEQTLLVLDSTKTQQVLNKIIHFSSHEPILNLDALNAVSSLRAKGYTVEVDGA